MLLGSVFKCCAVKTDGTLWTWGEGSGGCLGHGNETTLSSPSSSRSSDYLNSTAKNMHSISRFNDGN